jgi:F-type H+-transporting ATPase subunit gamma
MAGGQERILRRRIRSIQSTQKITRAQELIAASRIVKAQAAVAAAEPYSATITQVVRDLAASGGAGDSPLLVPRPEVRRVAFIVVAADRGLSGAYNSSVIREAERALLAEQAEGRDYSLVLVGRKAESYFRYREYKIDAVFSGFSEQPSYEDARQVGAAATSAFLAGETDVVEIVYTEYRTAGVQAVVRRTLMPLARAEVDEVEAPAEHGADAASGTAAEVVAASYEFEPSPEAILDLLLPNYVNSRVYAALLNAAASEHTARQRAMKAATDNADDLIISLSRVMNRARQDAITTEIMEIVSGSEALRQGAGETDLLSDTIEGRDADLFAARGADA